VLGDSGYYAIQTCLMLMQLGLCISILIFTHDFLQVLMCTYNITSLCNSTAFYIIFSLIVILPLSFITNVHYFYIPAFFANVFILLGIGALVYYDSDYLHNNPVPADVVKERFEEFNFLQLPMFFGIAVFAYEGIGVMFNIRASMQAPKEFPRLIGIQFIVLTLIYIIIPTLCLLTFGDATNGIIFFNLPQTNKFFLTIEILYTCGLLCSYPIQIYPAFKIIETSNVGRWVLHESGEGKYVELKRVLMRLMVVSLMFLVAYTTKSFPLFINLLGSFVFTLISFVIPIWIYQEYYKDKISWSTRIVNWTILVIGVVLGTFGVVASIKALY